MTACARFGSPSFARWAARALAITMLPACATSSAPPDAAVADTWWERIDEPDAWWLEGGKDPKDAPTVARCDELAPGFATMHVDALRAGSDFNAYVEGCDIRFSWASGWPTQLFQKQLSLVSGCRRCEIESWDGFELAGSTLHLRLVRHRGELFASFDSRWRPDLDEVLVSETGIFFTFPDGARGWGTLDTECSDGTHARRCLSFDAHRFE